MKKIFLIAVSYTFLACNHQYKTSKEMNNKIKENTSMIFPKGNPLPADWFVGNAFLTPLLAKDKNNEYSIGSVTFEHKARTNWHTHPKGQVLIVTDGEGWYQEKGKPAQPLKKGSVVNIPENVEHWHGASAHSSMTHIAITNYLGEKQVEWLLPVTDEEYNSISQK